MIYCIPTYHRADNQRTLQYLESCGVPASDIVMSVQCESDYRAYQRYANRCTLIYKEGKCVGDNRNNLLEYAQSKGISRIVMLDDDISTINVLLREGNRRTASVKKLGDTLPAFINRLAEQAGELGVKVWGCYPFENPFFQKRGVSVNSIFTGTLFGINDTTLRFDARFIVKEDYELCLRLIARGEKTLRFDYVSTSASHKTGGDCKDDWEAGRSAEFSKLLLTCYPDLVRKGRQGEIIRR
jgi:hypothetical protein